MDKASMESLDIMQDETDIRVLVQDVIEQVGQMTCSVSMDSSVSSADTSKSPHKNGRMNYFQPESQRSKHRSGNRKHRVRYRKHKYKPYKPFYKLSATERRRVEERNSRRAYRSREKMSVSGLTLAPGNTTQFLIADQDFKLEDRDMLSPERRTRYSEDNSSEDFYSSPDDEQEFIQQQFSETYDTIHDAYINDMSKSDLVRELLRVEDLIESLEHVGAEMEKIGVFKIEIQNLLEENHVLEQINKELRKKLSNIKPESKGNLPSKCVKDDN